MATTIVVSALVSALVSLACNPHARALAMRAGDYLSQLGANRPAIAPGLSAEELAQFRAMLQPAPAGEPQAAAGVSSPAA